jgi:hypothetical protein
MTPGTVFTTLHFLCNLQMSAIIILHNTKQRRLTGTKIFSQLGPFVSYEKNEVLKI